MKVFLSWSGQVSKNIAEALKEWIPLVIPTVTPWVSSRDIEKGTRPEEVLSSTLEDTDAGIVCLTAQNLSAPWILFEAGALAKKVSGSRLWTLLFNLDPADVAPPLGQLQHTKFEEKDFRQMVESVSRFAEKNGQSAPYVGKQFDRWWPDLKERVDGFLGGEEGSKTAKAPQRTDRLLLEEMLEIVRSLQKRVVVQTPAQSTHNSRFRKILLGFAHAAITGMDEPVAPITAFRGCGLEDLLLAMQKGPYDLANLLAKYDELMQLAIGKTDDEVRALVEANQLPF
jgi:hypothetical protein